MGEPGTNLALAICLLHVACTLMQFVHLLVSKCANYIRSSGMVNVPIVGMDFEPT